MTKYDFTKRPTRPMTCKYQPFKGTKHIGHVPGLLCKQCGREMNPAEAMLGPVCGKCTNANHKKATGKGR